MIQPNPIHDDAGGQWIVGAGDRLSQFQTPASSLKRLAFLAAQNGQKLSRCLRAVIAGIATNDT
jgi:hypothetical protein